MKPNWRTRHTLSLLLFIVAIGLAGSLTPPLWSWILIMALLLGFIAIAGHGITSLWRGALVDDRNRISLSRLQLVLWTTMILSAYLAAAMQNMKTEEKPTARNAGTAAATAESSQPAHPLGIQVPRELWLLMGISVTSMVGSPLIRSTKRTGSPDPQQTQDNLALLAQQRGVLEVAVESRGVELANKRPEDAAWSDLLQGEETGNGAHLDLGKVQNLYFTLVLVVAYALVLGETLGRGGWIEALPAFDASMIAVLGISHAGYLAYKAAPHSRQSRPGSGESATSAPDTIRRRERGAAEHPETELTP